MNRNTVAMALISWLVIVAVAVGVMASAVFANDRHICATRGGTFQVGMNEWTCSYADRDGR